MLENIEILLVTTGRRWSYLVWEPNYHSLNFKNLVAIEMKKIEIIINKPVYLWLLKYLCMYVKPKYGEKAKMCYMDKDRIIVYKKIDNIYKVLESMFKLNLILQIMN